MSFDALAPIYRGLEMVLAGSLLQRCRTAHLHETVHCRRALLLGEGPGKFLQELLRARTNIAVTVVERSGRMIEETRRQLHRRGLPTTNVSFVQADATTWQPPSGEFDLIVTNFFLDCFPREQLTRLVAKMAASSTKDARWLLTDFRLPEQGWQRWRGTVVLALMYGFFRVATRLPAHRLTPPDELLRAAGFHLRQRRLANHGLVHADLWTRQAE